MRYEECSKQDVRFVLASISDAEIFGQLRKQCWQSTYRGIYPDEIIDNFDFSFHLEQDIKRLNDKQYKNFLIKRNNVNIGYMTLKFNSDFLLIQSLYLLANEQCKGIGNRAFQMVRSICAENRMSHFICYCHPNNGQALTFYRKMGGRVISHEICSESWQNSVCLKFEI